MAKTMDKLKDLVFRYAVLFGRRFYAKEKIAFLRVISKELATSGYHVDARIAKLKLTKRRYENYYNAYIGDIENAELIICTHYDTGINNYNLTKSYAFEQHFGPIRYLVGILPVIVLTVLSVVLNYVWFVPAIQSGGFFSLAGIASVLSTLLLFYFILKFKHGLPNKHNFISNTSSVIVLLNIMQNLDEKSRQKIAFVLYDGGCNSQYGLRMLESYSQQLRHKKVIFLSSLGNGETLQFFKSAGFSGDLADIDAYKASFSTILADYLMITAGEIDSENRVRVRNANSHKDNLLSISLIEQHSQRLLALFVNLAHYETHIAK